MPFRRRLRVERPFGKSILDLQELSLKSLSPGGERAECFDSHSSLFSRSGMLW